MKAKPFGTGKHQGERVGQCPECENESAVTNILIERLVGGDDYYCIDDGCWFVEDEMNTMSSALCPLCNSRSDWDNWPERNISSVGDWECSNCGSVWATKVEGDQCCQ